MPHERWRYRNRSLPAYSTNTKVTSLRTAFTRAAQNITATGRYGVAQPSLIIIRSRIEAILHREITSAWRKIIEKKTSKHRCFRHKMVLLARPLFNERRPYPVKEVRKRMVTR